MAFLEGAELLGVVPELLRALFQAVGGVADALDDATHKGARHIRVDRHACEGGATGGVLLRLGHREDGELRRRGGVVEAGGGGLAGEEEEKQG
jgi:hypothetical protein